MFLLGIKRGGRRITFHSESRNRKCRSENARRTIQVGKYNSLNYKSKKYESGNTNWKIKIGQHKSEEYISGNTNRKYKLEPTTLENTIMKIKFWKYKPGNTNDSENTDQGNTIWKRQIG